MIMPIRYKNNTKYQPIKIFDLFMRDNTVGLQSLLPENINQEINSEWIYYIMQGASYLGVETDLITNYIYEHFKDRVINDRYGNMFDGWDESTDFDIFTAMIIDTIHNTLISNNEKYTKIYKAQYLDFHPEWNVDGEEITERELKQTGTDTNAKTGNDTNVKSGNETDEKSGTEASTRTGSEADTKSGSETKISSRTTDDSTDFFETDKEVTTPAQLTNTKTYTNVKDEQSYNNRKDTHTYNSVQDKMTYASTDTETRNLTDKEITKHIRHGNIGVVSTVRLLQEYVELSELNILDIIASDVVDSFTYLTY